MRSLRLRLLKSDRIDEAQFYITSVQGDQSEINLSSGKISVDLLHKQAHLEEEGRSTLGGFVVIVLLFTNSLQYLVSETFSRFPRKS